MGSSKFKLKKPAVQDNFNFLQSVLHMGKINIIGSDAEGTDTENESY